MNIRTNKAGAVSHEHILRSGFVVYKTIDVQDIDSSCSMPQYKNGVCEIRGGYWTYCIYDLQGREIWEGWWNSNNEFDATMKELLLTNQKVK